MGMPLGRRNREHVLDCRAEWRGRPYPGWSPLYSLVLTPWPNAVRGYSTYAYDRM